MSSSVEAIPIEDSIDKSDSHEGETADENVGVEQQQNPNPPKQIIRYSTSTLFALRSSKLSQQKPSCKNMDLACFSHHHKPPPKMLLANMMPKFALNQMSNRGEESISPLSFHSNSSSSSNLSYQKRYQDGNNGGNSGGGNDGYSNSRYYYNKYKSHDDSNGGGSSRIIYKTTGANASNGNSIRFLKKAYNSKYEEHESGNSLGLISNKNILDNASRVITAADHRNSRKKVDDARNDGKATDEKTNNNENNDGNEKKKNTPSDEANNNSKDEKESTKLTEVNANDLMMVQNDLKKLPDKLDISNHLDDLFNDLNINQLLDEKITDERESSRFSKWFNIEKEETKEEKLPDSQNNNNNADSSSSSLFLKETEKFFQPIDKVENNSLFQMMKGQPHDIHRNDPLLNMLQKQQQPQAQKSPLSPNSGQIHSVEELEAKLRQHKANEDQKNLENEKKVLQNFFQQQLMPNLMQQQQLPPTQQQQQHMNQSQDEINAFKKLLSQIANDDSKMPPQMMGGAPNGQNVLQQLMTKNFQQQQQPNPEMMMQYQKAFPMAGGKMPNPNSLPTAAKMMNPLGAAQTHMMPQQFGGNVDMKFMQQQQQQQPQQKIPNPISDIIKRPEVQALVQELTSGEISQYSLWQRLAAPGLTPIEREIITCALNIFNANSGNPNAGLFPKQPPIGANIANNLFPQGTTGPQNPNAATTQVLHQLMQQQMKTNLTAPIPMPPQTSPLSPVPPLDQHLLFQHPAAAAAAAAAAANKQLRLSPLPAGMPQRIPSPRELQYHTQSIMQNALIRKKLEEQRENYRKRQEQEKQESAKKNQPDAAMSGAETANANDQNACITPSAPSQQPEEVLKAPVESPSKKAPAMSSQQHHQIQRQHAPSPSIFTPTSVLRKMTAEKESDGAKIGGVPIRAEDKKKSSIVGVQQQQQSQNRNPTQQQAFMNSIQQMDRMKMQNDANVFGMSAWDSPSMKPPGRPIVKSSNVGPQNQMMGGGGASGSGQPQNNPSSMMPSNPMNFDFQQQQMQQKLNLQKAQYLQQQQMMQMKKQQMDNPVLSQFMAQQQQRAQSQSQQFRSQQFQQQQQQANFSAMMQGANNKPEEQMMESRNCLSPTSNQLAKWFSPELLADASAGKLLPSLNVGQMLSLEELEKCMQNS